MRIFIEQLDKWYGQVQALHQLSLELPDDVPVIGVLGRNGAGKSTLLKILVGLLRSSSGRVRVFHNGREYGRLEPELATYVPENTCVLPNVKGRDFLDIAADMNRLVGVGLDESLRDTLIDAFDLRDSLDRRVGTLSKGNQRKMEVVAACSADVGMIVADELTSGFDVAGRLRLARVIREAIAPRRQLLVSSHDLSFICDCCDAVAVIDQGKVVDMFSQMTDHAQLRARVAAAFQD